MKVSVGMLKNTCRPNMKVYNIQNLLSKSRLLFDFRISKVVLLYIE